MSDKLKPCPMCGVEARIDVMNTMPATDFKHVYFVECECGTDGPPKDTVEDAIATWNRRAIDPMTSGVKRLVGVARFIRDFHPEIEMIDNVNLDDLIAEAEGGRNE